MSAISQQKHLQNYSVKTSSPNVKFNPKNFKTQFYSEYKRYCGLDQFISPKIPVMDIVNKKLQSISKGSCRVEEESELIGMLSKQLYLAGNQMQRMQTVLKKAEERLKSKEQEIERLKRKVREWEVKTRNQESHYKREMQKRQSQIDNAEQIQKRCMRFEARVGEMEKFLADYGLIWVGDNLSKSGSKTLQQASNDFITSNYALLMGNIKELNLSVGKDEVQVHHNHGLASFKSPSCMTLKFYKNGIIVQKGRLRPYTDPQTRSFIQDILDGYFPSELQRDYPNGVPFKVEDHKTEMYLGEGAVYPGHGYQLGKVSQIRSSGSCKVKDHDYSPKRVQTPKQRINSSSSIPRMSFSARPSNVESTIRAPKIPSSARLGESDLSDLRSQILASHNHNCSDSHLQSHINAELALTSRSDKKASLVPNNNECHLHVREQSKYLHQVPDAAKNLRFSSYRSAFNTSFSVRSDFRTRARSASVTGSRCQTRPASRAGNRDQANVVNKNVEYKPAGKGGINKVRGSKSATIEKPKNGLPIVREINSPTGEIDELQLKVRSLNGGTVYLVHVSADDSVSRLYQLLDKVVLNSRRRLKTSYKIVVSGYAPRRLDHPGVSLRDYGIYRNCVLHLVND
ncbi:uncharacterized protein LOC107036928 [Diachasma alloeum]|uniref:uncharacterized protein LOC107036928 n=1 Tax=Diachasma alloeum TaxID=454923 RepID=UPI0007383D61|nr:uncharacterized protein LOC107036928 [Diachasma alloeum]